MFLHLTRSRPAALIAFAGLLSFAACGDKDKKQQPAATGDGVGVANKSGGKLSAGGLQQRSKAAKPAKSERKPLTLGEYEALLLALSTCSITGEHIDSKCPAKQAFISARPRIIKMKDLSAITAQLGKKHIAHASPAVRIQAAVFLAMVFRNDESAKDVIVASARTEKEPAVLISMLQAVASKGATDPKVGTLLLDMADHESELVRKKSIVWLGTPWSAKLKGSLDKLIAKIEKDSSPEVRQFACRYSGARGDDRMIPIYERYTADPKKDPKLYAACFEGLMKSWLHYPLFATSNQKAYQLTLKRLGQTPRSPTAPPWGVMDNFAELAKDKNEKVAAWKQQAPWYKPADVLKVLRAVVLDRAASRLARAGALKSMVALGSGKTQLQAMHTAYADAKGNDDLAIARELDRLIRATTPKPAKPATKPKPAAKTRPATKPIK